MKGENDYDNIHKIAALFIIPADHKYGDYDMVEHQEFLNEVPEFEKMIVNSDIILFKFYFSVSKEEQNRRFEKRKIDPLKQFKISPVDEKAQE